MNIFRLMYLAKGALGFNSKPKARSAVSVDTKIASILFASSRGDYYQYLADTIESTKGQKGILDIFRSDAERYKNTARGKLCAHWARMYTSTGGSLARTFAGTIPAEDASILHTLQRSGGEKALENALRDLAENSALISKARAILFVSTGASLVSLAMTLATIILLPTFMVPYITDAFSMLPLDRYPPLALKLVHFSDFVKQYSFTLVGSFALVSALAIFSLSRVTGTPRKYLDKYGMIWSLYRDFQSIRFLSTLAALIRKSGNATTNLREAVDMQFHGASTWKTYHLLKMRDLIKRGKVGPALFATGMLDQKMVYFITDVIESRGLGDGLQFVKVRLKDRVMKRISIQSVLLAWVLMAISIGVGMGLLGWQMAAIDELRKALQMYLS